MKKTLAILLSLVICILSGCHAVEESQLATEATIQTQPALETPYPLSLQRQKDLVLWRKPLNQLRQP